MNNSQRLNRMIRGIKEGYQLMEEQSSVVESLEAAISDSKLKLEQAKKKLRLRTYVIGNIEYVKRKTGQALENANRILLDPICGSLEQTDDEIARILRLTYRVRDNEGSIDMAMQRKIMELHKYEFNEWEKVYGRDRHLDMGATTWKILPGHAHSEYAHGIQGIIKGWMCDFVNRQMSESTYNYIINTQTEKIYIDVKATSKVTPEIEDAYG